MSDNSKFSDNKKLDETVGFVPPKNASENIISSQILSNNDNYYYSTVKIDLGCNMKEINGVSDHDNINKNVNDDNSSILSSTSNRNDVVGNNLNTTASNPNATSSSGTATTGTDENDRNCNEDNRNNSCSGGSAFFSTSSSSSCSVDGVNRIWRSKEAEENAASRNCEDLTTSINDVSVNNVENLMSTIKALHNEMRKALIHRDYISAHFLCQVLEEICINNSQLFLEKNNAAEYKEFVAFNANKYKIQQAKLMIKMQDYYGALSLIKAWSDFIIVSSPCEDNNGLADCGYSGQGLNCNNTNVNDKNDNGNDNYSYKKDYNHNNKNKARVGLANSIDDANNNNSNIYSGYRFYSEEEDDLDVFNVLNELNDKPLSSNCPSILDSNSNAQFDLNSPNTYRISKILKNVIKVSPKAIHSSKVKDSENDCKRSNSSFCCHNNESIIDDTASPCATQPFSFQRPSSKSGCHPHYHHHPRFHCQNCNKCDSFPSPNKDNVANNTLALFSLDPTTSAVNNNGTELLTSMMPPYRRNRYECLRLACEASFSTNYRQCVQYCHLTVELLQTEMNRVRSRLTQLGALLPNGTVDSSPHITSVPTASSTSAVASVSGRQSFHQHRNRQQPPPHSSPQKSPSRKQQRRQSDEEIIPRPGGGDGGGGGGNGSASFNNLSSNILKQQQPPQLYSVINTSQGLTRMNNSDGQIVAADDPLLSSFAPFSNASNGNKSNDKKDGNYDEVGYFSNSDRAKSAHSNNTTESDTNKVSENLSSRFKNDEDNTLLGGSSLRQISTENNCLEMQQVLAVNNNENLNNIYRLYIIRQFQLYLDCLQQLQQEPYLMCGKCAEAVADPPSAVSYYIRILLTINSCCVAAMEAIQLRHLLPREEQIELILYRLYFPRELELIRSIYLLSVPIVILPSISKGLEEDKKDVTACSTWQVRNKFLQGITQSLIVAKGDNAIVKTNNLISTCFIKKEKSKNKAGLKNDNSNQTGNIENSTLDGEEISCDNREKEKTSNVYLNTCDKNDAGGDTRADVSSFKGNQTRTRGMFNDGLGFTGRISQGGTQGADGVSSDGSVPVPDDCSPCPRMEASTMCMQNESLNSVPLLMQKSSDKVSSTDVIVREALNRRVRGPLHLGKSPVPDNLSGDKGIEEFERSNSNNNLRSANALNHKSFPQVVTFGDESVQPISSSSSSSSSNTNNNLNGGDDNNPGGNTNHGGANGGSCDNNTDEDNVGRDVSDDKERVVLSLPNPRTKASSSGGSLNSDDNCSVGTAYLADAMTNIFTAMSTTSNRRQDVMGIGPTTTTTTAPSIPPSSSTFPSTNISTINTALSVGGLSTISRHGSDGGLSVFNCRSSTNRNGNSGNSVGSVVPRGAMTSSSSPLNPATHRALSLSTIISTSVPRRNRILSGNDFESGGGNNSTRENNDNLGVDAIRTSQFIDVSASARVIYVPTDGVPLSVLLTRQAKICYFFNNLREMQYCASRLNALYALPSR